MKCGRRCSPSVTRSRPASSWSRMATLVASSRPSRSRSPSRLNVVWLRVALASHLGRGKLPMVVAAMGGSCMDEPPVAMMIDSVGMDPSERHAVLGAGVNRDARGEICSTSAAAISAMVAPARNAYWYSPNIS